jgi:hypothetical protein
MKDNEIEALIKLLETIQDTHIRWLAALSLENIDSGNR